MTHVPYTPPEVNKSAFHCPNCHAYSEQMWRNIEAKEINCGRPNKNIEGLRVANCVHCRDISLWYCRKMVHPDSSTAPFPNADLPEDIKADYEEARSILSRSPRGAAALYRLCIQKLCVHLGQPGKDLNSDIKALVEKGLSPTIQKSLDIVRVIGNEAVHPGQMDLKDKSETASQLAMLINMTADAMITQPQAVNKLYGDLPKSKREEIEKRDQIELE